VTGKEDKGDQRGVTEKDDGQISSRRCDQLYTWKTLYPMFTEKLPNVLHVNVFVDILWLVDKGRLVPDCMWGESSGGQGSVVSVFNKDPKQCEF
jgi:hypothetical protein